MGSMRIVFSCLLLFGLFFEGALAQEPPSLPKPTKENDWLKQFAGSWSTSMKGAVSQGKPAVEHKGKIESRMVGAFWVVNEMESEIQGTTMQGLQTIGYDSKKKRYVGTWIDSMVGYMWRYEGTVDESGKKLTLEADGPNFMTGGKPTKFRDAYEFKTPDLILIESSMLGQDGKWKTFLKGEAKRTTRPPKPSAK